MCAKRRNVLPGLVVLSFLFSTAAGLAGEKFPIISNGSLGAVNFTDGYYTYFLNTDNRSIDVYTFHGGYSTGPSVARVIEIGGREIAVFDFTTGKDL